MTLYVTVYGIPAPQGSKRFVGRSGGKGRMVESSKAVEPWREAVRAEAQRAVSTAVSLPGGPLAVELTFYLARPKSHYGKRGLLPSAPLYPTTRPDLDKLTRAALDGLVAGGAIRDDSDVVHLTVAKDYADHLCHPGLYAVIDKQL